MPKKRIFWYAAAGLVIAAAVFAGVSLTQESQDSDQTETPSVQTATARKGSLVVFASGAGQVIPSAELGLAFSEPGTITEILVQTGEEVDAGQVLVLLDTGKTEADIAASVAQAEIAYIEAKQALEEIHINAPMNTALALQTVDDAEQNLADTQNPDLLIASAYKTLVEAEQIFDDAQRAYNNTQVTSSQMNIDAAYADVILKQANLERAQDKYDDVAHKSDDDLAKANAITNLSTAQYYFDVAQANYNALISKADPLEAAAAEAELKIAQAEMAIAQRDWEAAQNGPSAGDIAIAEAELSIAELEYEQLQGGADELEIALAEAQLVMAEAELEIAKQESQIIELTAPFAGTIMSVDGIIGEEVGTSSIISLADLSLPVLDVYLDEVDLDKVVVGYEAEIFIDAIPDEMFTGKVVEVNPSLVTISGAQTVNAKVILDADSFAKPQTLMVGMNASVDVIGGRAENAVIIPIEALRELGTDEYAVFVMENDEPKLRVVTVGLQDFTSAEITSGLEVGEIITTGIVETE